MVESLVIYRKLGYTDTERETVNGYQRIYMNETLV